MNKVTLKLLISPSSNSVIVVWCCICPPYCWYMLLLYGVVCVHHIADICYCCIVLYVSTILLIYVIVVWCCILLDIRDRARIYLQILLTVSSEKVVHLDTAFQYCYKRFLVNSAFVWGRNWLRFVSSCCR